jgi:hypothetical protein
VSAESVAQTPELGHERTEPSGDLADVRARRWRIRDALLAYAVAMTVPDAVLIALYYSGVHISVGLGTLVLDLMILATALYVASRRGDVGLRDLGIRPTSSRASTRSIAPT